MTLTSQIEVKNLVVRLKAGEKSAFTDLYTHYSDALYGVIKKVLRSEESAGDVLQDSFVKIWKNIDKYDESKGSFFTWMLNICRNTSIDKLRKLQREGKVEIQTFETFVSTSAGHQVEQNVDQIGLKETVDTLDPEQKIIVEYLYFGGYTQQEVSDELNIPLGTVKTRARAALKALRKVITLLIFWI